MSQALALRKGHRTSNWLLDSGFEERVVRRTIWETNEQVLSRVSHQGCLIRVQYRQGQLRGSYGTSPCTPARVHTTLVAKRDKQLHIRKQSVEVEVAACPLRLSSESEVRRKQAGQRSRAKEGLRPGPSWLLNKLETAQPHRFQLMRRDSGEQRVRARTGP